LEDVRLNGSKMLKKKGLVEMVWEVTDWIDLAQDRSHWRAVVNTVMNLRVQEPAFSVNVPCRLINRRVLRKAALSVLRIQVVQKFGSKNW
jgi:hypothetical protein